MFSKNLMSRKHSSSPRPAVPSSFSFIVCCVATKFQYIIIFSLKTEPSGSSRHSVTQTHLVHGTTPPFHPTWHFTASVTVVTWRVVFKLQQWQPGPGMKGRRQKSQCEAEALDISALGAGPEVGNGKGAILHGSASSLVDVMGGGGYWSDLDQVIF